MLTQIATTLYRIHCTGPTDKTRLSFISVNSSFNKCVRTYSSSKTLSSLTQLNECEQDCEGQDLRNQNVTLDASATHTFTSCSWKDCSGKQGPAISFRSKTSSSLRVSRCTFLSCESTSTARTDGGGSINAYKVKSVTIISSLFQSCSCSGSGGGVLLYSVTQSPLVQLCSFISCSSVYDAGGICIYSCGNNIALIAVQECCFFSCYCPDSSGAYEFATNNCRVCSSCLYCSCTSNGGGASWIAFYEKITSNEISFSVYNGNAGNVGKDLYFYDAESNIIFHSFTTSPGPDRVWTYKLISNTFNPNWLPHTCCSFSPRENEQNTKESITNISIYHIS